MYASAMQTDVSTNDDPPVSNCSFIYEIDPAHSLFYTVDPAINPTVIQSIHTR